MPFYAGLTDSKIAGRGIRWQDSEAASLRRQPVATAPAPAAAAGEGSTREDSDGAPGESRPTESSPAGPDLNGDGASGLTLGTYRDLWADSTTDLSPALNYLMPAQRLEISVADAKRLGLSSGDEVSVKSGETSVNARVAVRGALPEGTCFLIEGTVEGNANVFANGRPARVEIGKPEVKLDLVAAGGEPPGRRAAVVITPLLGDTNFVDATWILIVKSLIIFIVILSIVPVVLLVERKLLGRFQQRYGPNRVGPYGALQPLADVGKLLSKQGFRPKGAVPFLYEIAPAISIFAAVATLAILPFGDVQGGVGLYGIDVPIGILYFFAFGAIAFYGLLLGGWASGSKYSFLGAMRSAAQLISYEIAMGLSLLGVVMMAGSLSLVDIVKAQGDIWYVLPQIVGFLIFMVAGFAETNRVPFDLPEADAELVAGYSTEYGGMRFGSYFFAEYMEILIVSGIAATMFFGGWMGPGPPIFDPIWMLAKMLIITGFFIWIRATLPRFRYDQLMSFGWKVLVPIATLNVLVTAVLVVAL